MKKQLCPGPVLLSCLFIFSKKCRRFPAFFLMSAACLLFLGSSLSVHASGQTPAASGSSVQEDVASPEPEPASEKQSLLSEESGEKDDPSGPADSSASPFQFSEGTITGFTEAYLETLTQSGTKSMTLTIPSEINGVSVKGIGAKAFQDLRFLTGVLQLPNTITDIGAGAFSGTGFSTVYLPKSLASCGASAFDGGSVLIFANQDSYDRFAGTGITPDPSRTGYQFTLRLKNADGTETKRKALFSFPLNWEKNAQGVWAENPAWKLPAIPGGDGYSDCRWVFDPSDADAAGVTETSPAAGSTLYAVRTIVPPVIRFGPNIDAVYNEKEHSLSVTAEHPLSVSPAAAGKDSVRFFYTWTWTENGK